MSLDGQVRDVPVVAYAPLASWIDKTVKVTFADPDAAVEVFALNGNVSQEISLDEISGRRRLGRRRRQGCVLSEQRGRGHAGRHRLRGRGGPGVLEGMGIWWDRLIRGFTGQPTCAEAKIINSTPLIYDKQSAYVS